MPTEHVYSVTYLDHIVPVLWCSHCNELEAVRSCMACHCKGIDERVVFVLPHVVCYGCASTEPAELLNHLVVTEVSVE